MEKQKRLFRHFNYVSIGLLGAWIAIFILSKQDDISYGVFAYLWLCVNHLLFLYYIGRLAAASNKSATLWVLGSCLIVLFGPFVAYFRMRINAMQKGWL